MVKLGNENTVVGTMPGPPMHAVMLWLDEHDEWSTASWPIVGWVLVQGSGYVNGEPLVLDHSSGGTTANALDWVADVLAPHGGVVGIYPGYQWPEAGDFTYAADRIREALRDHATARDAKQPA
jgi:hypothetical protein